MAEFNLRMQRYHDGSVLGLRMYMLSYWMSYQNRRFRESYWPAFIRCNERKSLILILQNLFKLSITWKCLPYHYFRYGLYEKKYNYKEMLNYLPETVFFYQILPQINKQMFLLDDKSAFESMIKGQNIAYPKTVFKTAKSTIFSDSLEVVKSQKDVDRILSKVKTSVIFCKPADCGSGGKGIFIFKRDKNGFMDDTNKKLDIGYLNQIKKSDWILQEAVDNSQDIKGIYKYSTNSFRVLTYFYPGIGAKVLYCILKFGNNKAFTDNAHTGGVYVMVDHITGDMDEIAYDENLYSYKEHPLSGVKFKGQKINNINEVVNLAEKLGNLCPSMAFIGWDIALTPNGAVVLEGNSSPGLTIIQRTYNGMTKFIELMKERRILS